MRAAVALWFVVVGAGCGSGAAKVCVDLTVEPINETATPPCHGPPVPATGLRLCHDPGQAQGHGLFAVCVADAGGAIYAGFGTSTTWIEGTGWTHSDPGGAPGTLSADAQARCARYDLVGLPACP
jgi:hypothetical protein